MNSANHEIDQFAKEEREWSNPPDGVFKVNWDAALAKDHSGIGVEVIIRDGKGLVIAALSKTVHARMDPVTIEATAALHVVELCRDVGVQDLILEGDSMVVVKAIESSGQKTQYYGQIIEDIRVVLGSRRSWRVCHTKREANGVAYGLAKEATRDFIDKIRLEDTPLLHFPYRKFKAFSSFVVELWLLLILLFSLNDNSIFFKKKKKKKPTPFPSQIDPPFSM